MSDFNFDFGGLFKLPEQPPKETEITSPPPIQKWEKRASNSEFVEPQRLKDKQDYRIRRALSVPTSAREWSATFTLYLILPTAVCESTFAAERNGVDWGWTTATLLAGLCAISYFFIQWLLTRYPSLVTGLVMRLVMVTIAILLGVMSIG
ncbi:MAG: hypothetical protein WBA77_11830 [Microcoleaceae cyanobacterium]